MPSFRKTLDFVENAKKYIDQGKPQQVIPDSSILEKLNQEIFTDIDNKFDRNLPIPKREKPLYLMQLNQAGKLVAKTA